MTSIDKLTGSDCFKQRRSGQDLLRARADYRDSFARDRARVVHSAAFRRLQAKTQVLGIGEGDFHRTRLTHSMEVAQIARGIVRCLYSVENETKDWRVWLPGTNLIETIALCHDLGHPPFGHGGEVALNFAMRDFGGFEGNGQTLRLLTKLEAHTEGFGLDLTRRTLLGVIKYPVRYEDVVKQRAPEPPRSLIQLRRDDWKPPKCYMSTEADVVEWTVSPFSPDDRAKLCSLKSKPGLNNHGKSKCHAFDTSILELADDIAYGVHDFEDAIALRLVSRSDWDKAASVVDPIWGNAVGLGALGEMGTDLFERSASARKQAIGGLVNAFIVSISVSTIDEFEHPLLRYQATIEEPAKLFLDRLKTLIVSKVIKTPQVQTLEYRGQQIIVNVFEALSSDPERLLKDSFRDSYQSANSESARWRVICDYIAGMTDEYATRLYERLFLPRHGLFSDRL